MTIQTEHSPFPSDETLAAYIDGHLDEETRRRVVEHMAECPECFDIVMSANEMARATQPGARVITWPRKVIIPAAIAAAVAAVVFLTPVREQIWPPGISDLAAVAPPERFSDGRISGFEYRPRAHTMRGTAEHDITSDPEGLRFEAVALRVQERAAEHPDARSLHAAGVSEIVRGHGSDAVKMLERARQEASSPDPQLLSDLAAAYIAANRPNDAAITAESAWKLAQTPEIAWNRAAAAEMQHNTADAIAKWNDYLRIDPSSRWALDAREKLQKLQSP